MIISLKKDIVVVTDVDWLKACQPLTWRSARWSDGRKTAYFFDSKGHGLSLHRHTIADNGAVTPSVVCPIQGCGFHEYVILEGWNIKEQ